MILERQVSLALLALALAGPVLLWLDLHPDRLDRESVPPVIPAMAAQREEGLLEKVLVKNLWDKERGRIGAEVVADDTGSAEVSKSCKLKAIAYAQMSAPLAQFDCEGQSPQSWHENDRLPDQSLLVEIHADYVVIVKEEERLRVYLFGKE